MGAVRMGEIAVSSTPGDELVALGLGSCIGLAMVDRAAGVAGVAHVVLPQSRGQRHPVGKFADLAVPALISRMLGAGARERRLEAVLAGGARMFELGADLDVGARNEEAVRGALERARVEVRAAATGGSNGRTLRAAAGDCMITVREAGGETVTLLDASGFSAGADAPSKALDTGARP
jgi:chemotaxis protein CheD